MEENNDTTYEPFAYTLSLDDLIEAVTHFNQVNGAFKIDFVLRPNVEFTKDMPK